MQKEIKIVPLVDEFLEKTQFQKKVLIFSFGRTAARMIQTKAISKIWFRSI